ncbi:MAG: aquaporin [Anaerolineae bacterium]|nr:aquaporin [Chloroflexota bacterium]MBP6298473.1 aquaporin [Anaerolineae bacterium]
MNPKLVKPALAELLGTFILVFIGAAAVVSAAGSGGVVTAAFGHGLVLVGIIFAFGHISGGHFNPAVTLAMLIAGKVDLMKAVYYWIAQFVGAIVAGLLIKGLLGFAGPATGTLTSDAVWTAAIFEAVVTFIFVSVIFQTAAFGKAGNLAPVAIGFTLAACIFAAGPFTGGSLNPARTFGPALASGDLSYFIPYFVGIFGGAALAALVQTRLLND